MYNIVTISKENIFSDSVRRILQINRNKVLKCNSDEVNKQIQDYLLDIKPYVKRAIISSVINEMSAGNRIHSLCVKDSDFEASKEYYSLADVSRKLSVICTPNNAFNNYCNECYNNLGLRIECSKNCREYYDAYLDIDNILMNKSAFLTVNGCQMLIYADESYFNVDENVAKLLRYDVPKEFACASLYM